jgi:hypothetical protein
MESAMKPEPTNITLSKDQNPEGWELRYRVYCDVLNNHENGNDVQDDPRSHFAEYWKAKQQCMHKHGLLKGWQIEKLKEVGVL